MAAINYFEEHTPLKPLVALVTNHRGFDDIKAYLANDFTPHLAVITIDASDLANLRGPQRSTSSNSPQRYGILHADWLSKHQTKVPAVAAVLVSHEEACGDPSSWAALAARLDTVRSASKQRGTRVVIVVLRSEGSAFLPDDRAAMLSRQAGVDKSCVVTCTFKGGPAVWHALGVTLHAQAAAFYAADAQRRLAAYSQENLPSVDLNLRAAFKMGALAEQRCDWSAAARLYREAYRYVPQVAVAGAAPLQRFLEVRTVAELINYRLLFLLLRCLKQPKEAAAQLDEHMRLLSAVPMHPVPLGIAGNHMGWVASQLSAAAGLVVSSGLDLKDVPSQIHPAQLYLAAARAASTRRSNLDKIIENKGNEGAENAAKAPSLLIKGRYLGQYERSSSIGGGGLEGVADSEVEAFLESEETAHVDTQASLELLQLASSSAAGTQPPRRIQCQIEAALGEELLGTGDISNARQALEMAASKYRCDGWQGPLWQVLLLLRDCAGRSHDVGSHICVSLEASALTGGGDVAQRRAMAEAAVGEIMSSSSITLGEAQYECKDSKGSPWTAIFDVVAGFVDQGTSPTRSGQPTLAVAVRNKVPATLPLRGLIASFDDSQGSFQTESTEDSVDLVSGCWRVCHVSPTSPNSGMLTATNVTLRIGPAITVNFALPGAMFDGSPGAGIVFNERIKWGQRVVEVPPRHAAPAVSFLSLPDIALVGEFVPIRVNIVAGEDGIQDCRLVVEALPIATTSGGLSPRGSLVSQRSSSELENALQVCESPGGKALDPKAGLKVANVSAKAQHSIVVYLSVQSIGSIYLNARLTYKAAVNGGTGVEAGSVVAASTLSVVLPFEIDISVAGPPRKSFIFPSDSDKTEEEDSEDITAQTAALSLSPNSSKSALLAMDRLIAPRLSSSFVLPSQQRCLMTVALRSTTSASFSVTDVQLVGLGVENNEHLSAAPFVSNTGLLGHVELAAVGATCSFPFSLTTLGPASIPSIGTLHVLWRRRKDTAADTIQGELKLSLPGARVTAPRVSAAVVHPREGAMGEAMQLELELKSGSDIVEEFSVLMGEPNGFLLAGARVGNAALAPGGAATVKFAAVPYHTGLLKLPDIKVVDALSGLEMEATKNCEVFVNPQQQQALKV